MNGPERQRRFRQRQQEAGQTRVELWLDQASAERLQQLASARSEPTGKARVSGVITQALAALTGSHSQEQGQYVTGNDSSNTETLERRVWELHNAGKTAREIAPILAAERLTGRVYAAASINRLLERIRQQRRA